MCAQFVCTICHDNIVFAEKQTGNGSIFDGVSGLMRVDCFPCIPARYMIAVVGCLGFVNVYALRVNLSVAVVQMDASTATVHNGSARVKANSYLKSHDM